MIRRWLLIPIILAVQQCSLPSGRMTYYLPAICLTGGGLAGMCPLPDSYVTYRAGEDFPRAEPKETRDGPG